MAPAHFSVPTLTDGTLTLRRHAEADVDAIVEQCADPLSRRWTTVPLKYGRDDARRFVREILPGGWAADHEWAFAVEMDGRFGGTVSLRNEGEGRAEIAYGSHPWFRGTGGIHRALSLLLDWGYAERGLRSVIWLAHVGNWASRKAAWRLGFTFVDGPLRQWLEQRGELRDAWAGTLLADDSRDPKTRWLPTPVLRGERVLLRPPRDTDVPRIVEACADEVTQRWFGRKPGPYGVSDALAWLESCTEGAATGREVTWAVADPADDRFLGSISVFDVEPDRGGEVGYLTHPEARARGLTTEACRLVARHAFEGLGLPQLRATAAVDNAASRAVLARAGFRAWGTERRATTLRDGQADAVRYELTADELA